MRNILYYVTATGEITADDSFEDDALVADIIAEMEVDESYMDGVANLETDYITFPGGIPTVTLRPVAILNNDYFVPADNTITVDFALPTGTIVTFDDTEYTSIASEHFQFKSNGLIGTYEFDMEWPFPYMSVTPLRITVYAV